MNQLYPIFIKPASLDILIVGGGAVAAEKLLFLSRNTTPHRLRLISPHISREVRELLAKLPNTSFEHRAFEIEDLQGHNQVIVAANDKELARRIFEFTRGKAILINCADVPEFCDFYLGGVVTRGDLKIGISSNGAAPVLASRIREYLENALPDDTNQMIQDLRLLRGRIQGDFGNRLRYLRNLTRHLVEGTADKAESQ